MASVRHDGADARSGASAIPMPRARVREHVEAVVGAVDHAMRKTERRLPTSSLHGRFPTILPRAEAADDEVAKRVLERVLARQVDGIFFAVNRQVDLV